MPWILPLLAVALPWIAYIITHANPAGEYGLYAAFVRSTLIEGYPNTVSNYQPVPVPFAFPPLAFFVIGALRALLGVSFETVALILPGAYLLVTAYLTYLFARSVFPDSNEWVAAVTAAVAAGGPQTLWAFMLADGVVSGLSLLFCVGSWVFAVRVFRNRTRIRYNSIIAGALFGLTALSHPRVAVFAGYTILALWVVYDRSRRGFAAGILMAVTGFGVVLPWLAMVTVTFGYEPVVTAMSVRSTHFSPIRYVNLLRSTFALGGASFTNTPYLLWTVAVLGGFYSLARQQWFPVLFVGATFIIDPGNTFTYIYFAEAFLAAPLIVEGFPSLLASSGVGRIRETLPTVLIVLFVLSSVMSGMWYTGTQVDTTMTPEHRQAMNWIEQNTDEDATFTGAGPGGRVRTEVLPYYTDRRIVGGYWGAEWTSIKAHESGWKFQTAVSSCTDASCLHQIISEHGFNPNYVYVLENRFVVDSLADSPAFTITYRRDGVAIARVNSGEPSASVLARFPQAQQEGQRGGYVMRSNRVERSIQR
jgi:hypothetical protein